MTETLSAWIQSHWSDYEATSERLEAVNNVVMHGDISDSAKVVEKAYMFAVLSIQTERSRHENAFVGHYTGNLTRKEAALETVYGGHKKNWMAKTFKNVNWEDLTSAIRYHSRNGNWSDLLEVVVDNVTGVSYRKASFMLAMCGFTTYMCIDSNVGRYAGIDPDDAFYTAESYFEAATDIWHNCDVKLTPFVTQWAIYDFERGEHARHMTYFNEVL